MEQRGDFLESALVHGNHYGTSRVWIEKEMAAGNDVLLEIDWQGARQVRARFPGTVGIFILPPRSRRSNGVSTTAAPTARRRSRVVCSVPEPRWRMPRNSSTL